MELFKYVTITGRTTKPKLIIGLVEDLEEGVDDPYYGFTYGDLDVAHMLANPHEYQDTIDTLITGGSEDHKWNTHQSVAEFIQGLKDDKTIIPFENEDGSIMDLLHFCLNADPTLSIYQTQVTGMNKEWEDVKNFHETFNHPVAEKPTLMGPERAQARYTWLQEEIDEFLEAEDIVEQADAMIDTIYFALGTLVELGIKPEALFNIVQDANMAKVWSDGKPRFNDMGKVIKPQGWQDPHEKLKATIEQMK